jgi:hypothetical protein
LRVQRFDVDLPDGLVERAREELLSRGSSAAEGAGPGEGSRWGYLLGVEDAGELGLDAAAELESELRRQVVEPLARVTGREYSLSFLKTLEGPPPQATEGVHFDGYHLDTHPEITADEGIELARVLINLSTRPRRLRVARTDRFELARAGVPVHRGDYQVVELPPGIREGVEEIPGRTVAAVSGLRFWASVVPHVGREDEAGHFLASYEAVAPFGEPA